jgi:tetratricopeptide (TPR) repeat protein
MVRLFWSIVGLFLLLSLLLALGVLPGPIAVVAAWFVNTVWMLACPLTVFFLIWAPGVFRETTDGITQFFSRVGARRLEVEDLHRKIAHLDKAHHMAQLGNVLLRQGRVRKAAEWFAKALEKDPQMLDARYRLGLCRFGLSDYGEAVELLEEIYREKPQYDYGLADLRLAQSHQRLGNLDSASEVYETLLRFYPGQPEGAYSYAQLMLARGDRRRASELMRDVVFSVRHSPGFQRRRNRHWLLKAKWWLLRNGRAA